MSCDIATIFWLLFAIIAPALAAYPVVRRILPGYSLFFVLPCSFAAGMGLMTIIQFYLNAVFNIPLSFLCGIVVVIGIAVFSLIISRYFNKNVHIDTPVQMVVGRRTWEAIPALIITGLLFMVLWRILNLSLSSPVGCIPGMGDWGAKARFMFGSGMIPWANIMDSGLPYMHGEYPLGYPIFLSWVYSCMGGFDDFHIKLIPCLFGFMGISMIVGFLGVRKVKMMLTLLAILLVASDPMFKSCCTEMYAETCLLLFVLPGVFLVYESFRTRKVVESSFGVLLLAMSAWIKNEGLMFLSITTVFITLDLFLVGWKKDRAWMLLAAGIVGLMIFAVPWRIICWWLGIGLYDFGPHLEASYFGLAWMKFIRCMIMNPMEYGFLWSGIVLFAVAAVILKKWHNGMSFVLFFLLMAVLVFTLLFVFSSREIGWHLNALPRILMVPGMAGFVLLSGALCDAD